MKIRFLHRLCLLMACSAFLVPTASLGQDQSENADSKKPKVDRAEEKRMNGVWKTSEPVPGFEEVDLWKGLENGDVELVYRTVDAYNANITVKNKSERHLAIRMPTTFASVPVVRQGLGMGAGGGGMMGGGGMGGMGGMGGGGMGMGGGQMGGGGMGGGMGGGGMGGMGGGGMGGMGMGMGGGGGMFNIPPGRDGMVSVKTLCLEHGNTDPTPKSKYTMRPLDEFVQDARLTALLRLLAHDQVDHGVAQAAAWNMLNSVSWDELAKKNRVELMDGYTEKFFNPMQLGTAQKLVALIEAEVKDAAEVSHESRSRSLGNQ